MAITIDDVWFELQRRGAMFKKTTTMPDGSLLNYDTDPNLVNKNNSDGEQLIYYCPQGTLFQESNGTLWRKKETPNVWTIMSGSAGGGSYGTGGGGSQTFAGLIDTPDEYKSDSFVVTNAEEYSPENTLVWLDASDSIQENGILCDGITDKSENNYDVQASPHGTKPTITTHNSLSALEFTGDTDMALRSNTTQINDVSQTWVLAFKVTTVDNEKDAVLAYGSSEDAGKWELYAGEETEFHNELIKGLDQTIYGVSPVTQLLTEGVNSTDEFQIVSIVFDRQSNTVSVWKNGVLLDEKVDEQPMAIGDVISIFSGRTGDNSPAGVFLELVSVPVSTTGARERIEGYLAHKWDLTDNLSDQHTYKNGTPANLIYSDFSVSDVMDIVNEYNTSTQVITRGALFINTPNTIGGAQEEYLSMQSDNLAGDSTYDDVTYDHAMVLPYNTQVEKIILRCAASQGATVNMNVHSNRDVTDIHSGDFKFFAKQPIETQQYIFTNNNEPGTYTYTESASANAGNTLGISISGDRPLGAVNATIVLKYTK